MPYKDPKQQKKSQNRYYLANKEAVREATRERRRINRAYIRELKEESTCAQCPEDHPACLDFHHLGDKDNTIARASVDWGLKRLKAEVAKCVIVCSNCHRKIHAEDTDDT